MYLKFVLINLIFFSFLSFAQLKNISYELSGGLSYSDFDTSSGDGFGYLISTEMDYNIDTTIKTGIHLGYYSPFKLTEEIKNYEYFVSGISASKYLLSKLELDLMIGGYFLTNQEKENNFGTELLLKFYPNGVKGKFFIGFVYTNVFSIIRLNSISIISGIKL